MNEDTPFKYLASASQSLQNLLSALVMSLQVGNDYIFIRPYEMIESVTVMVLLCSRSHTEWSSQHKGILQQRAASAVALVPFACCYGVQGPGIRDLLFPNDLQLPYHPTLGSLALGIITKSFQAVMLQGDALQAPGPGLAITHAIFSHTSYSRVECATALKEALGLLHS